MRLRDEAMAEEKIRQSLILNLFCVNSFDMAKAEGSHQRL